MQLFFITLAIFLIVIALMAVGVMMGRPRIKGSCGGPDGCELCEHKSDGTCPREACEHECLHQEDF